MISICQHDGDLTAGLASLREEAGPGLGVGEGAEVRQFTLALATSDLFFGFEHRVISPLKSHQSNYPGLSPFRAAGENSVLSPEAAKQPCAEQESRRAIKVGTEAFAVRLIRTSALHQSNWHREIHVRTAPTGRRCPREGNLRRRMRTPDSATPPDVETVAGGVGLCPERVRAKSRIWIGVAWTTKGSLEEW